MLYKKIVPRRGTGKRGRRYAVCEHEYHRQLEQKPLCLMFSGCLIQLSTSHLEYKGAAILNISARIWNITADKKKKSSY